MKKMRILALAMALAMTASVFAGCSNNSGTASTGDDGGSTNNTDVPTLEWYGIGGTVPADFDDGIAAINDYLAEKNIGAKVNVTVYEWGAYEENFRRMINGGDYFDIMFAWGSTYNQFVQQGAFMDITEKVQSVTPDLYNAIPQELWTGAQIDGKIYAVPTYKDSSMTQFWYFDHELVEKYNIDVKSVHTMDDLTPIFKQVKEGEGDTFYPVYLTKGNPWNGKTSDKKGAHPNSRFTAPTANCPCLSSEFENPQGVPISAFIFGGRRAKLTPLVYQSKSWNHGVFVGSVMGSETTAAATGAVGVIRRDPMAMLPFCGYNMGDYWKHWIEIGQTLDPDKAPKIFNVNWFRKDDEGNFLWPGFGDNMRVLDWIVDRCEGKVDAQETAIGYLPYAKDINLDGLDMTEEQLDKILDVDKDAWEEELKGVEELYAKFGDHLPKELADELATVKANLEK